MSFRATNFTVSILLLMALTVFMAFVRIRKPVDNNWPFFYWILIGGLTISNPDLFDFRVIVVGLIAGLMLRFEFMNQGIMRFAMLVEMVVGVYILYASWMTIISY